MGKTNDFTRKKKLVNNREKSRKTVPNSLAVEVHGPDEMNINEVIAKDE